LRNAAVMKIVNTFLKTSGSNIEESNPEGLQAIITMAFKRRKTDYAAHWKNEYKNFCAEQRSSLPGKPI